MKAKHIPTALVLAGALAVCQVCGHETARPLESVKPCTCIISPTPETPDASELESAIRESLDKAYELREEKHKRREELEILTQADIDALFAGEQVK